ncbi:Multidrug resistance efflux pump [Burkholderia sp. AU4i]|nr:Multidrug resistance efflux pump [Burkholderia sp. AU4i]
MGEPHTLRGHVQSIVAAIEDRDRTQGANLLPNVNPAFSWVRLAQRVPVRVVLDEVPDDFRMIAGRTATVSMREADTRRNDNVKPAGAGTASAVAPGSTASAAAAGAAGASQ